MSIELEIDYAVSSEAGDKGENADAADARVPQGNALLSKGVAAAIADGMSSSEGGKEASQICVSGFLNDYFSTPVSLSSARKTSLRLDACISRNIS